MLLRFEIDNFKSYRNATLELGGGETDDWPLTVLIGANASGKTNLIEGLRLLSSIAGGARLDDIRPGRVDAGLRGSVAGLGFRGARRFAFGCTTDIAEYNSYKIEIELREGDRLHIVDERVQSAARRVPLFAVVEPSVGLAGDIAVAYDNFKRGGKKPRITCTDQQSVLAQIQSPARFQRTHQKALRTVPRIAQQYETLLRNVALLDPRPRQMRGYSFRNETRLNEHGSNLSAVLCNICADPGLGRQVLDFIRDVPEQDIRSIEFIETPRGEVMVKLVETFGSELAEYDASQLSDGTLRILAVAAAMLTAPEDGLLVVEEIDNGVHPSRVEQLVARICDVARQRRLRVLVTSHNPTLLDALPDAAVADVVFCYRDAVDGASRLVRLESLPDLPKLVMQGPLGRLLSTRTLDRFVKKRPSEEEARENALAWIEARRHGAKRVPT